MDPTLRRLRALAACSLVLAACGHVVEEPMGHATYVVVNEGTADLLFSADRLFGEGRRAVGVPAGTAVEVDRVTEGSGGHLFPSNFYERYTVERQGLAARRLYSNDDWVPCGTDAPDEPERLELCLHVSDADFP